MNLLEHISVDSDVTIVSRPGRHFWCIMGKLSLSENSWHGTYKVRNKEGDCAVWFDDSNIEKIEDTTIFLK